MLWRGREKVVMSARTAAKKVRIGTMEGMVFEGAEEEIVILMEGWSRGSVEGGRRVDVDEAPWSEGEGERERRRGGTGSRSICGRQSEKEEERSKGEWEGVDREFELKEG